MPRSIQVTPETLTTTAGLIEELADEYKAQYEQLYKETGNMAAAVKGKFNQAFIEQIDDFRDDFQKMYQLMKDYAEFLRKSAKAYEDTQNTLVSEARKLKN